VPAQFKLEQSGNDNLRSLSIFDLSNDYSLNDSVRKASQTPIHEGSQNNQMRKLIFAINIALDGCCDHTKLMADEETREYIMHLMRDVDLQVFGRKTYELMVFTLPFGVVIEKAACPNHLIFVSCADAWLTKPVNKRNRPTISPEV
jgi:hypothetical protein